ncbi:MAG: hypothetical protein H6Q13_2442 [Bacteroidetes bacterium]|jgi:hypothetical protein|nr:hypothetical protein [Bacteroidota bacterium]
MSNDSFTNLLDVTNCFGCIDVIVKNLMGHGYDETIIGRW